MANATSYEKIIQTLLFKYLTEKMNLNKEHEKHRLAQPPLPKTTPGRGDQTSRIPRVPLDHPGDAWSWMSTGSRDVGVAGTATCLSPRQRGVPPMDPSLSRECWQPPEPRVPAGAA